jgi:hypothetical protein
VGPKPAGKAQAGITVELLESFHRNLQKLQSQETRGEEQHLEVLDLPVLGVEADDHVIAELPDSCSA